MHHTCMLQQKTGTGKIRWEAVENNPLLVYEVASDEDECANNYNMFRFEFIILKKNLYSRFISNFRISV